MSGIPGTIPVHYSLGAFPRITPHDAAYHATHHAAQGIVRSGSQWNFQFSHLHMQICPQNRGQITPALLASLLDDYPDTSFRLHANVWLLEKLRIIDLDSIMDEPEYLAALKDCQVALGHPVYSLHPGVRQGRDIDWLTAQATRLQDYLGSPVAIEGMYPSRHHYFLSTWLEYIALLESDVCFALDFSHIKILCDHTRRIEHTLINEMLSSGRCLEIHISDNDGRHDQHTGIEDWDQQCWSSWFASATENTVVFTEEHYSTFMPRIKHA